MVCVSKHHTCAPGGHALATRLKFTFISFDISTLVCRVQRSKYNQQAPKPTPFDESQAPSSFTFPIDMEGPGSSRRPETILPPDTQAPAKEPESFPALPHKPSQSPPRNSVHAEQDFQELPASLEGQKKITGVSQPQLQTASAPCGSAQPPFHSTTFLLLGTCLDGSMADVPPCPQLLATASFWWRYYH